MENIGDDIKIDKLRNERVSGPFPYEDCRLFCVESRIKTSDLIPDLDMFFANIVGYASSLEYLCACDAAEADKAISSLSLDVFECLRYLKGHRHLLTVQKYPSLCSLIDSTEELRKLSLARLKSCRGK